jgi:beta-lactamase regulating signal transducer with metallopeptidase domain
MWSETVASWLLTLALHAGVLLTAAWIIDRRVLQDRPGWRELLWRTALFGAVLTASAQSLLQPPTAARIDLSSAAPATAAPRTDRAPAVPAIAGRAESAPPSAVGVGTRAVGVRSTDTAPRHAAVAAKSASWRPSWQSMLVTAWLAGAVLMMARLLVAWFGLERMLARGGALSRDEVATDAAALAIQARIAPPRLSALNDLASPVAALGGRIVLPCWSLELLDREQLRAMLAHETAHLARRDPLWKLAVAMTCALLWFIPLTRLARRRLDELAELACDAWAAIHLGNGRSLAECLAECAERRVGGVGGIDFGLAPAMAHRDSPLLQRIGYLIDGYRPQTAISRVRAVGTAVFAIAFAVAILPGFGPRRATAQTTVPPSPPAAPAPPDAPPPPKAPKGDAKRMSASSDVTLFGKRHQTTTVVVKDGSNGYSAKIRGDIEFNERDDDVARLGSGASASFSQTRNDEEKRVDYTEKDGRIERHYFVDNREQPLDAEAQKWVAGIVPLVIRETALDAKARVGRIYKQGGAGAVFDEIGRIESGYARSVYLKELAASAKLSPADVTRALQLVNGIDSDYERRNVLTALATLGPFDAEQQKMVIGQAEKISSDYERAELLISMLPKLAKDAQVRAAWLHAVSAIQSDYEHRRVLSALLDAGNYDDAILREVVSEARSIQSDYERRELLTSVARRVGDAERIARIYSEATSDIGSDYERREALLALIRAPKFGTEGTRAVLEAAANLGSDYECREVLVALARVMPNDAGLIERYRNVARRLSDSERGAAERALDRFAT